MFLIPLVGCFEPQPQYITTNDKDTDITEDIEENTNSPTSEPDAGDNNSNNSDDFDNSGDSDNTNTEPEEPSYEPELPTYAGGYNINPCNPEVQATGYAVGQVAGDFELIDQYGENLRLSDFCGNAVLLVSAAFW